MQGYLLQTGRRVSKQPIYQIIANDLRAAIYRGDHLPGRKLPTEAQLADDYHCNRMTVRAAVKLLNVEGLLDTTRGGSVVRDREPIRLPITRYTHAGTPGGPGGPWEIACAAQGHRGSTDVLAVEVVGAPEVIADYLAIPPCSPVVRRDNRMHVEDQVLQLQTTWLPLWVAQGTPLAELPKIRRGIYGGLADAGHSPTSATEVVTARMPTSDEQRELRLRLGSPVMDIRRTSANAEGEPVVHTHLVIAADSVSLVYQQDIPHGPIG